MRSKSLFFLVAVIVGGCSSSRDDAVVAPAIPRAGRVSSSIVVLDGDTAIAVASADQSEITFVDADSLLPTAHVAVSEEPRQLLLARSGALYVTTHRGGELLEIDVSTATVSRRVSLCAGAMGLSESPDGSFLVVACENEGTVVRVDTSSRAVRVIASGISRPRAVLALDDGAIVAGFTGGAVTRIGWSGPVAAASLVPSSAPSRPAITKMTGNLASSIVTMSDRVWVSHELVNHTGDNSSEVVADDYGSVIDGNPKINPALSQFRVSATGLARDDTTSPLYASYVAADRAFSGPSAVAVIDDTHVLVAHEASGDVAILDMSGGADPVRGSVRTGSGPRGIAVDSAHHKAFVDNALDGSVSRIDLSVLTGRRDADLTQVLGLAPAYSQAALSGRRLFHDATNRHMTPAGVVACATCHPDGGDDGLIWFVHTQKTALKRRRTPHLANATSADAPYHWNGEFPSIPALVTGTITDLMAGDALLVDVASVGAYIDEIVKSPVPPAGDSAAIARGAALFDGSGCSTCHVEPSFTDGMMHAPLSPMSLMADDVFTSSKTPALHGLFLRAPYFHDGRAQDLHDLITRSDAAPHSGPAAALSAADVGDLAAYLSSL